MFETSVVQARAQSRGKYTLLTVSLIAHSAVIIGAIAIGIASVSFPKTAPNEFGHAPVILPVRIPPPLGNPNAGAQPKPRVQPQQKQTAPPPTQITAPPAVPETVTPVQAPSSGTDVANGPATGTEQGPIGVPWGTKDSIGELDAPPLTTTQQPVEEKIYKVGEVKAPVMIHRVEPAYPPALVRAKLPGKVAVHCVIDKNGRVRDAEVVFATMPAFADSVLRALKEWRYQPASLRGQAVDCYLDLTVDFGVR